MRPRGGRARRLRMTELSTHGAWLRTSKPLEEGTLVDVVISLDAESERRLQGEVMWVETRGKGAGMALEWLGLDDEGRRWLQRATSSYPAVGGEPSTFEYADAV